MKDRDARAHSLLPQPFLLMATVTGQESAGSWVISWVGYIEEEVTRNHFYTSFPPCLGDGSQY